MYYRYKPKKKNKKKYWIIILLLAISYPIYLAYEYRHFLLFWEYTYNKLQQEVDEVNRIGAKDRRNKLVNLNKLCNEYKEKNLYIKTLTTEDLPSIDLTRIGLHGSPTKVHKVESVVLSGGEAKRIAPTKEGIGELIDTLLNDHILG